jgi:hypothetical protein
VNILGGTNSISIAGTVYGAFTPYTIPVGAAYTFNFTGGIWYCFVTTDMGKVAGLLPIANGGTGLTTLGTAGQALVVNGGATGLTYTSVVGMQGAQGAQGSQGSQGATGSQGAQGFQGATGTQGAQGYQGSQGYQGAQGTQGATGTQGVTGAQGATGAQGSQGSTGAQGSQGATGSQGAQGYQGAAGAQGSTGSQGSQGYQGAQGYQGSQGYQGAQGSSGNNATGVNGQSSLYSITSTDLGGIVNFTGSSAETVTISTDSTLSLSTTYGQIIEIIQTGTGQVTFAAASGVTIYSTGYTSTAPVLRTRYSSSSAIRIAANTWIVVGDIV